MESAAYIKNKPKMPLGAVLLESLRVAPGETADANFTLIAGAIYALRTHLKGYAFMSLLTVTEGGDGLKLWFQGFFGYAGSVVTDRCKLDGNRLAISNIDGDRDELWSVYRLDWIW
jgi:hypothetical protein